MNRVQAAVGSGLFLFAAPGVMAGLVPWLLTGWDSTDPPIVVAVLGAILIVAGTAVVLLAFARFVLEGRGTPAPIAPTDTLVVGGLYRFVRNPMYVGGFLVLLGQAIWFGSTGLLLYTLGWWLAAHLFIVLYEEPHLAGVFGTEYDDYRRTVPRWIPKLA